MAIATQRKPSWRVIPEADSLAAARFSGETNLPLVLCKILLKRGINSRQEAEKFLNPAFSDLIDPFVLPDLEKASDRIILALKNKEKIMLFGDYDVDGITATALLYLCLSHLGGEVSYYLPNRLLEGYGLSKEGIKEAQKRGAGLIVSVDCGMTAVEEADFAQEIGINLIITDHHEPKEKVPDAYAVVNPKRTDYPGGELSGVGVAFKLISGVFRKLGLDEKGLIRHLDLVALGTSADIVPLTKENRILVKLGLEQLEKSEKFGIQDLILNSGLEGKKLATSHIVFGLAPRINAVGRLGDAQCAIKLLSTTDPREASQLALFLEMENRRRREIDERTMKEALEMAEREFKSEDKAIVLVRENWHPGIVGIIAARIAEIYYRPTVLLALDGQEAKGSARSIPSFHLFEALNECKELLIRFGGHKQAAGLALEKKNLESFKEKLQNVASQKLTEENLIPQLNIDCEVNLDEINQELVTYLEQMAPFGPGNMRPVLVTKNLGNFAQPSVVGNNHLKLRINQNNKQLDGIAFEQGDFIKPLSARDVRYDLAYVLENNFFNGNNSVQLRVKDIKLSSSVQFS
ncbi:MAG: Single-stranded-DNA-specific exonuclease RecJ [candidate division Zixibacteria bacterium RBG-1]|nr:MAG: Single-stranded-DNA-specific exonuclease RecJ [candidate division Zixibacteria bacterium RBG-1]OGC85767.1 MAG: single-stranded-DNA-specific exonuclease RecJ [candidate division Zixibacteria bacterium RBG_19FT_COMBO_42_43]